MAKSSKLQPRERPAGADTARGLVGDIVDAAMRAAVDRGANDPALISAIRDAAELLEVAASPVHTSTELVEAFKASSEARSGLAPPNATNQWRAGFEEGVKEGIRQGTRIVAQITEELKALLAAGEGTRSARLRSSALALAERPEAVTEWLNSHTGETPAERSARKRRLQRMERDEDLARELAAHVRAGKTTAEAATEMKIGVVRSQRVRAVAVAMGLIKRRQQGGKSEP